VLRNASQKVTFSSPAKAPSSAAPNRGINFILEICELGALCPAITFLITACKVVDIVFALHLELCVKIAKRHNLAICLPLETICSLRSFTSVLQGTIARMLTA
jgi:hypothetical protein